MIIHSVTSVYTSCHYFKYFLCIVVPLILISSKFDALRKLSNSTWTDFKTGANRLCDSTPPQQIDGVHATEYKERHMCTYGGKDGGAPSQTVDNKRGNEGNVAGRLFVELSCPAQLFFNNFHL